MSTSKTDQERSSVLDRNVRKPRYKQFFEVLLNTLNCHSIGLQSTVT